MGTDWVMEANAVIGEGLHPRGWFGVLRGLETPILSTGKAGTFDVPVDWASVRREDAPAGVSWPELEGTMPPGPDFVRIPLSEFTDLRSWNWYAWVDDEWCWVGNIRDNRLLIATDSSATASKDPDWEGDYYNGWDRWIDPEHVQLKAESRPVVPGQAST